jgi:hypothetical protein
MPKPMAKQLFLSYSSKDKRLAIGIQRDLEALQWTVWRDEISIGAGTQWSSAIDTSLRASAAVVVLVTRNSATSAWVTYEYAFATGAGRPVVAVVAGKATVPDPIRKFQIVRLAAVDAARSIHEGLLLQIKTAAEAVTGGPPVFVAKFREDQHGRLNWRPTKNVDEIPMELWLENVPPKTTSVDFSVLADVRGKDWTLEPSPGARPYLADDVSLYGDVDIVARGHLRNGRDWTTRTRLYDALVRYYTGEELDNATRRALEQIRQN